MKQITEPGEYQVTIRGAYWTEIKDGGLCANLPGYFDDKGDERGIIGRIYMTNTYIKSGKNAGKTNMEVNNDLLIDLGMKKTANGFIDPTKMPEELEGKQAFFVVAWEDDNSGTPRLKVKYVNAGGRPALDTRDAANIFANLIGSQSAARTMTPPPPMASQNDGIGNIPF